MKSQGAGTCRICGCGDMTPCTRGCAWVNTDHTLCSACLDKRWRLVPFRGGGGVALIDKRSGYRRCYLNAREASRAAVELTQ